MIYFTTKIRALDPLDGEIKTWAGPNIKAISWGDAEDYCRESLGYCKVDGILEKEIPVNLDTMETGREVSYDYWKN